MPLWGLARQSHKAVSVFGAGAGVHRAGGREEMMMSRLEVHEDGGKPTSVLASFDLCGEGGLAEEGALCHRA